MSKRRKIRSPPLAKHVRLNITVPAGLRREMLQAEPNHCWSRVACEAFRAALAAEPRPERADRPPDCRP